MPASGRPAVALRVATPVGPAEVLLRSRRSPRALVVLGHGAGGGVDSPDLRVLAERLPPAGYAVALVVQPYRVAGRRAPAPAAHLDRAWLAVLGELTADPRLADRPLVVGGRSAGARVACRTGRAAGARGVLALAFPLHPPGRPERSRAGELAGAGLPVLVLQGDRDPFGGPAELPAGPEVVALPAADHSLRAAVGELVEPVLAWLDRLVPAG